MSAQNLELCARIRAVKHSERSLVPLDQGLRIDLRHSRTWGTPEVPGEVRVPPGAFSSVTPGADRPVAEFPLVLGDDLFPFTSTSSPGHRTRSRCVEHLSRRWHVSRSAPRRPAWAASHRTVAGTTPGRSDPDPADQLDPSRPTLPPRPPWVCSNASDKLSSKAFWK